MRKRVNHGFTLLEVLAVIVIILVIAGWIISAAQSANGRAARIRAQGEITDMSMACERYKTDYGSYPRSDSLTEQVTGGDAPIDPLKDGNPNSDAYKKASLFLYVALSGDENMDGKLTPPDEPSKGYMDFYTNSRMLAGTKDKDGKLTHVLYIQDPFGNSYGYSTAGAKQEDDFKADAKANGSKAKRAATPKGINPSFDLWSTGGKVIANSTPSDSDRNAWVKNW
jgi:prepilin-type N-terminal cleavage/methylation domain-containing protein